MNPYGNNPYDAITSGEHGSKPVEPTPAVPTQAEGFAKPEKPLGIKAYGSIGHLPNSRMGPGDHAITEGQAKIATIKMRDKHDRVYVQEKLDGSCCSVAKIGGKLASLGRAGYYAETSKYEMHHAFHRWVLSQADRFDNLLQEGERVVGEWMAQAHGTRYNITDKEPFVPFDIMIGTTRHPCEVTCSRVIEHGFTHPRIIATEPITVEEALVRLGEFGFYGATEPIEGAVWRVERMGKVDFLCKYVRPDKVDGLYLHGEPVWNEGFDYSLLANVWEPSLEYQP